jgi:hypothetical protein
LPLEIRNLPQRREKSIRRLRNSQISLEYFRKLGVLWEFLKPGALSLLSLTDLISKMTNTGA